MSTFARARELASELEDAGIPVAVDPRSAVPPCVLFQPPQRTYDLPLPDYTVTWRLVVLVPGPGGADAWSKLDELTDQVVPLLGPSDTEVTPASYQLPTASGDPLPAYIITFTEGTD